MTGAGTGITATGHTAAGAPEPAGAAEGSSAAGGVMAALAWVPRLVALHLAWVALVLLGAVVAGIAPATTTLVAVLRRRDELEAVDGSRGLVAAVLRRYRVEFMPANRAAGPFVLIALAAAANVALGVAGALPEWFFPAGFAVSILLAAGMTLAAFHAIALHELRPSAPAPTIWRGALAGVVLLPLASASFTITVLAALTISAVIQPLALLAGGGILIAVTSSLLVRSWQIRLDAAMPRPAVAL